MELTLLETQVSKIACYLGIIQAVSYGTMSLTCIILYNIDYLNLSLDTYMDIVTANIYVLFLRNDEPTFTDQTLYSKNFAICVWIYFIISIAWFGVSVGALIKEEEGTLLKYLSVWCHLTFLVALWDLIVVVIIGVDYNKCLSWADAKSPSASAKVSNQGACVTGILPVLAIAARGFTLWIVNVVVAAVLGGMVKNVKKRKQHRVQHAPQLPAQPMTSAYVEQSVQFNNLTRAPDLKHFEYPY